MVSPAGRTQLRRVDDTAGLLTLLVLEHPSMATAYVVNDTRDWTISGTVYVGLPFRLRLPGQNTGENPSASLEVDNVGRALTAELEKLPLGAAVTATIRLVSRATPTVTEFEFQAPLSGVSATVSTVTATMGHDDAWRAPAVKMRYDPGNSPGLFEG